MGKTIKNYLHSFKLKKEHWYTLFVDLGFVGAMVLLFYFLGDMLKEKAELISQGKTTEQIQQMLLSSPEQAEVFLASLKGFVLTFAIGAGIILIGGLLIYSLSRKLIWDHLLKKKFNRKFYWKWNSLNLVLIVLAVIYLFASGLVRLVLGYLFSLFKSQAVLEMFYNLSNMFFLFLFVIFIFLVYYSFSNKYKVWESIGHAFHLIKTKKELRPVFLLVPLTAMILALVLWPLGNKFVNQQNILIGINIAVSLLFLAWIRVYVFKTARE